MGNVPTHITTETKYSSNYKSSRLGWSLNRFFGIRREESATVRMFFLHHFFLGLGQMMFFFGAITKFLEKLNPIELAKVFGFSAIVLMIVGRIYSYFEHHIPFKKLLPRVLLFLIFMTIALRFALYFLKDDYMLKLFEVAFFVVYLLSNLEFWGLSALVFDVRQGKRLFSLISAGDVPAKLLGYVCVSLFVPKEKENLLFISAIAFIISYFILENLLPKIDVGHAHHHHPDHTHEYHPKSKKFDLLGPLKKFFDNKFIFNLAILSFLYYAVFIMIEFMFFCFVEEPMKGHKGESDAELRLSQSLSGFLSISYGLIFILKLTYSGRLLNRIGIKRALLAMPVILGIFSVVYWFYGTLDINNKNIFFIGIMAMTAFVVKYALNDPTFLVLFQPLAARFRLYGHTVIKAFVQSIALGVTGLTLWASYEYWGDKVNFFYYLNFEISALIVAWIFVVFICYKNYLGVLNEAIKKRFISGTELAFNDNTYLKILKEKLSSHVPEETLFAMNSLEKLEPHAIKDKVPELLHNTHEGVLSKTIEAIVKHRWTSFTPQLYKALEGFEVSGISSQVSAVRYQSKRNKIFC